MRLTGYDMLVERFGESDPQGYHIVYNGEVEVSELGRIYEKFDGGQEVPDYTRHSLSVLDVIESYNEEVSRFYYVDYRNLKQVAPEGLKPVQPLVL